MCKIKMPLKSNIPLYDKRLDSNSFYTTILGKPEKLKENPEGWPN